MKNKIAVAAVHVAVNYKEGCFGRMNVEQITGLKLSAASNLIKLMKDSNLITPVTGQGKGFYCRERVIYVSVEYDRCILS